MFLIQNSNEYNSYYLLHLGNTCCYPIFCNFNIVHLYYHAPTPSLTPTPLKSNSQVKLLIPIVKKTIWRIYIYQINGWYTQIYNYNDTWNYMYSYLLCMSSAPVISEWCTGANKICFLISIFHHRLSLICFHVKLQQQQKPVKKFQFKKM